MQIAHMNKLNCMMSSTDGYFGVGEYDDSKNYETYNKEKFFKTLKRNIKKLII